MVSRSHIWQTLHLRCNVNITTAGTLSLHSDVRSGLVDNCKMFIYLAFCI